MKNNQHLYQRCASRCYYSSSCKEHKGSEYCRDVKAEVKKLNNEIRKENK